MWVKKREQRSVMLLVACWSHGNALLNMNIKLCLENCCCQNWSLAGVSLSNGWRWKREVEKEKKTVIKTTIWGLSKKYTRKMFNVQQRFIANYKQACNAILAIVNAVFWLKQIDFPRYFSVFVGHCFTNSQSVHTIQSITICYALI